MRSTLNERNRLQVSLHYSPSSPSCFAPSQIPYRYTFLFRCLTPPMYLLVLVVILLSSVFSIVTQCSSVPLQQKPNPRKYSQAAARIAVAVRSEEGG